MKNEKQVKMEKGMKGKSRKWLAMACGLALFSANAFAQKAGNGGEGIELRLENIKSEIRNWILATEFKDLDLDGKDPKSMANLVLRSLNQAKTSLTDRRLLIGGKERTCINYPQTQSIECNRAKLNAETDKNLYPLMLHEYMGLAGLEQNRGDESDYKYSKQARDFVEYKMVAKLGVMRRGGRLGKMKFVVLPGGTFQMGSAGTAEDRFTHERQHTVTVSPFEMQTTEVTQAQYFAVMGSNPSNFKSKSYCPSYHQVISGVEMCPNYPVEDLDWNQATAFAAKLNQTTGDGYTYRLPREAEWEFAARAGSNAAYSFGDDASQLEDHAWFDENSHYRTHAVAEKKPNAYGLFDMHGNVMEWVQDWYGSYYYQNGQADPTGPASGSSRVYRGGSWYSYPGSCWSAVRDHSPPENHGPTLGFRLVRTR